MQNNVYTMLSFVSFKTRRRLYTCTFFYTKKVSSGRFREKPATRCTFGKGEMVVWMKRRLPFPCTLLIFFAIRHTLPIQNRIFFKLETMKNLTGMPTKRISHCDSFNMHFNLHVSWLQGWRAVHWEPRWFPSTGTDVDIVPVTFFTDVCLPASLKSGFSVNLEIPNFSYQIEMTGKFKVIITFWKGL